MKELNAKAVHEKVAADKQPKENQFYTIPNEACCSAEFSDGCIFNEEI